MNNEKLHLRCGEQYQPSGFIERGFLFGSDEDFKFIAYNGLKLPVLEKKSLVLSISVKRFLSITSTRNFRSAYNSEKFKSLPLNLWLTDQKLRFEEAGYLLSIYIYIYIYVYIYIL